MNNTYSALAIQSLIGLYFLSNSFRLLSYIPQIVQVYRQQDDVKAISLWTWGMWTASNFFTALYAIFALEKPDFLLSLLNLGNSMGCLSVICIVIYKRKVYAQKVQAVNAVEAAHATQKAPEYTFSAVSSTTRNGSAALID